MKKPMRAASAGALTLAAMFSVSGCFGGAHGTPAIDAPQSLPGVGTDSGMQFNVTGITTASTLGNGFMSSTAKGVYVVVSMTVKNVSSNATGSIDRLNSDVLIDSTGRQYPSDYSAATNLSDSSTDTLQPGSWAPLNEAFDVPIGTTPTAIVMNGGFGTPGVRISLSGISQKDAGITQPTTAEQSSTTAQATTLQPPSGADEQGFLESYARCDSGNPPALMGSTAKSLVVVCQTGPGSYYYRGVNTSDGQHIELANAVRSSYGFDVTNPTDGTQYQMRPDMLKIISPSGHVYSQPMVQYASS